MANSDQIIMTPNELENLNAQLAKLKKTLLEDVAERLKAAIALGDLSENSEYDDARNEQSFIKAQINEIEYKISKAVVVMEEDLQEDVVSIGSKVKIYDETWKEEDVYHICGSVGADPSRGYISNESPIGSALMGKKAGDVVRAQTPGGITEMRILEVTRSSEVYNNG